MTSPRARVRRVDSLAAGTRDEMWALFQQYYDHVERSRFDTDLDQKDRVILLRDRAGRLCGFSTLRSVVVEVDGRRQRAVYSGDTVVAQEHWGSRALGIAFLRTLFLDLLRAPHRPLYWVLITKGYKTYLLMANNFAEHWPRFESPTPPRQKRLLDAFGADLFGADYQPGPGLVVHETSLGQLRQGIAAATPELGARNPRVAFFVARNPTWAEGTELMCLARMTLSMPFVYQAKALWNRVLGMSRRRVGAGSASRSAPTRGPA